MSTPPDGQAAGRRHTAGAYDVRIVIAALIGLYGIVLTVPGVGDYSEADRAKIGDVDANLWAGLAMLALALTFVLWARLRPVVVDPHQVADDTGDEAPGHH